MKHTPMTQERTKQLLRELRSEQYAALAEDPVNWDKIDRLGQRILLLEMHRRQALRDRPNNRPHTIRSAA